MPTIITASTPEFIQPTQYVGNSSVNPLTVAGLMTSFPPALAYLGMYARVTDLYGAVDDIMRCRYDGVAYRWVPQRPNFNGTLATTSGAVSLTPLVTPPTLRLTGALLGNISVTPANTNAYVGMQQRVVQEGTLGIFTSTITGLVGSNLTLLGASTKIIEFNGTGWFSAS